VKYTDIVVVGGGPAGLSAAINAASCGAKVMVIDRNSQLGGQLVKQTHMFFGSQKQYASVRGIDIAGILNDELVKYADNVEILKDASLHRSQGQIVRRRVPSPCAGGSRHEPEGLR
jgi:sarcosine oxidase subunit alpha